MNRAVIFFGTLLASIFALGVTMPARAQPTPASLAEQDMAAQSRGDVAAALALYSNNAIVQGGGRCWSPCVGKVAIRKELERRVAARNHATIIARYVSGNVAVIKSEVRLWYIDNSGVRRNIQWSPGVDRIIVWNIYEENGGRIAVVTLVGQRTDPQTARFITWTRSLHQK